MAGSKFFLTLGGSKQGSIIEHSNGVGGMTDRKEREIPILSIEFAGSHRALGAESQGGLPGSSKKPSTQPHTAVAVRLVDGLSFSLRHATHHLKTTSTIIFREFEEGKSGAMKLVNTIELEQAAIVGVHAAPSFKGKQCEELDLTFKKVKRNGVHQKLTPPNPGGWNRVQNIHDDTPVLT